MRPHATVSNLSPLAVIDFEASSLDPTSFPIELGLAVAQNAACSIRVWSTLIVPDPAWNMREAWDPDAQRIHGITRRDLAQGMSAIETVAHLASLLGSIGTVWCGDGKYDGFWLERLIVAATPLKPAFRLRGVAELDGYTARGGMAMIPAAALPAHRAGPDAERLCRDINAWSSELAR